MTRHINLASERTRREWAMQRLLSDPIIIGADPAQLPPVARAVWARHARGAARLRRVVTVVLAVAVSAALGIVVIAELMGPR